MTTTLNIVELIDKNPIAKLSNSSNNNLINKITENFTETQQQLFIASFYSYLHYDQYNDYVVNLDDVWKWLDFSQKHKAKELLEKVFTLDKDYKKTALPEGKAVFIDENGNHQTKKINGGQNKQTYMLNIRTFKSLCLKAGTKRADEIHEYYIKLEEIIYSVLTDENIELKYQLHNKHVELEEAKSNLIKERINKTKEEAVMREKLLLTEYDHSGPLVYIIKVKTFENGNYIVKIGESRIGIGKRYAEHKTNYEECLLVHCVSVNRSKEFETFIHTHKDVKNNRVCNLEGHEKERELFLIDNILTMHRLLSIINKSVKTYTYVSPMEIDKLKTELELTTKQLELQNNNYTTSTSSSSNSVVDKQLTNMKTYILNMETQIQNTDNKVDIILSLLQNQHTNNTNNINNLQQQRLTLGPRLQKINPETFQLVKVYDNISECMKEQPIIKRPSINKAINANTIYHGFRWLLVDRHLDPTIITNLQPTKPIKEQTHGFIAKLNHDKTEILNIYIDRKAATIQNSVRSIYIMEMAVKKGTKLEDCYYTTYKQCDTKLKSAFMEKHDIDEIILYKTNGIEQYNQHDNTLNNTFSSKFECIKFMKISDKTINKILDKAMFYKSYYYRTVEPKIAVL